MSWRPRLAHLLSMGVISRGWYAILTGVAMLYLAWGLWTAAAGDDAAVPYVSVGLALVGVWSLVRGIVMERGDRAQSRLPIDLDSGEHR